MGILEPGFTVTSPRGTVVEILENTPARFRLRRRLAPGTGRTIPHRHLDGSERFELLEGMAKGTVDGQSRILRAGDVLEVPPVWLQKAMAAVLGPIAERTGRGVIAPQGG